MLKYIIGIIENVAEYMFSILTIASRSQTQVISNLFGFLVGASKDLVSLNEKVEKTNKSIEVKIDEAQESLVKTSQVINELNELIEVNQKELQNVRTQYEHIAQLNEVSLEQARPLLKELNTTLKKDSRKNHIISFLISLFFFVCGAIFGPAIYDYFIGLINN